MEKYNEFWARELFIKRVAESTGEKQIAAPFKEG